MAEVGRGMTLSIAVGDWGARRRATPDIQRVDALVVDDFGSAPPTPQRRRSAPGHVIRLDPFALTDADLDAVDSEP